MSICVNYVCDFCGKGVTLWSSDEKPKDWTHIILKSEGVNLTFNFCADSDCYSKFIRRHTNTRVKE